MSARDEAARNEFLSCACGATPGLVGDVADVRIGGAKVGERDVWWVLCQGCGAETDIRMSPAGAVGAWRTGNRAAVASSADASK